MLSSRQGGTAWFVLFVVLSVVMPDACGGGNNSLEHLVRTSPSCKIFVLELGGDSRPFTDGALLAFQQGVKRKHGVDDAEAKRRSLGMMNGMEYHIHRALLRSKHRVHSAVDADLIFVANYAAYQHLGCEGAKACRAPETAVEQARATPWWGRRGGRDFVFTAGHPWAYYRSRALIKHCWTLVVDNDTVPELDAVHNGSPPGWEHPVVVPYVVTPNALPPAGAAGAARTAGVVDAARAVDAAGYDTTGGGGGAGAVPARAAPERPTLLYFNGFPSGSPTRRRILATVPSGAAGVSILDSHAPGQSLTHAEYVSQLHQSVFCLHLRGDTRSARRLFESIVAGCLPVIVSDGLRLPFAAFVDYRAFTIVLPESVADSPAQGALLAAVRAAAADRVRLRAMRAAMRRAVPFFVFRFRDDDDGGGGGGGSRGQVLADSEAGGAAGAGSRGGGGGGGGAGGGTEPDLDAGDAILEQLCHAHRARELEEQQQEQQWREREEPSPPGTRRERRKKKKKAAESEGCDWM
jgi:hypothetical protein